MPPAQELMLQVQLIFVGTHSAMGFETPRVPTIVEIGGLHVKEPKPLPKNLKNFMDSAKDGVIYFSLGSVMPESTMTEYVRNSIMNTFRKLKIKVLWKSDGNETDAPENVMMSKWFPQQSILSKYTFLIIHRGIIYR